MFGLILAEGKFGRHKRGGPNDDGDAGQEIAKNLFIDTHDEYSIN